MQKYTQVQEVPLALAVWLATDNYDYNEDPNTISATTLIRPVRQTILAARVPQVDAMVPLPSMVKNRIGAAIHDSIERAWRENYHRALPALGYPKRVVDLIRIDPNEAARQEPDIIGIHMEQRLKKKLGKWTITGKFDFVGQGRVQDFKSTTVWTYTNQVNNHKYALQGSIYRWLDPKLITEDEMDIHFIFTDWMGSKARSDPNYPPFPFKKQTFKLDPIPVTERYVTNKVQVIESMWDAPEEAIPPCTDEDLWRSEPVFKYYKNPENAHKPGARSTKNFESRHDAMMRFVEDGSKGVVIEKPGHVTACKFCPAFSVCKQKDQLIASGDLDMGT